MRRRSSTSFEKPRCCWLRGRKLLRSARSWGLPSRRTTAGVGGLKVDQATKLKELEKENVRLKKLLAEAELDKAMLKDLAEGNW